MRETTRATQARRDGGCGGEGGRGSRRVRKPAGRHGDTARGGSPRAGSATPRANRLGCDGGAGSRHSESRCCTRRGAARVRGTRAARGAKPGKGGAGGWGGWGEGGPTFSSCSSSIVFLMVKWKTVWAWKECLTTDTTYSASDSVSSTADDDEKSCARAGGASVVCACACTCATTRDTQTCPSKRGPAPPANRHRLSPPSPHGAQAGGARRTRPHTHTHTRTHTQKHKHAHARAHARPHARPPARTHARTPAHARTHTKPRARGLCCAHNTTQHNTHKHKHTHTHTHTQA